MTSWKRWAAVAVAAAQLAACSWRPESVDARYVSPLRYQGWSCEQLAEESDRLQSEVTRVSGLQEENADTDMAIMVVGTMVFVPLLLGLAATRDRSDELGALKGEHTAAGKAMTIQGCTPPETVQAAAAASPARDLSADSSPAPALGAGPRR